MVVVYDLDGTLYRGNTFLAWLRHIVASRLDSLPLGRDLALKGRVLILCGARLVGLIDRPRLKRALQRAWAGALEQGDADREIGRVVDRLAAGVRPELRATVVEARERGAVVVLATAAVADYAVPLARRLGIEHVLATPPADATDWAEAIGPEKRRRVEAWLAAEGLSPSTFFLFTNDMADEPLAQLCTHVAWFGDKAGYRRARERLLADVGWRLESWPPA